MAFLELRFGEAGDLEGVFGELEEVVERRVGRSVDAGGMD